MSVVDNLAAQNVESNAIGNFGSGAVKGLDAGLAYARAQDQSEMMKSQLDAMKSKAMVQKTSYLLEQIKNVTSTENKPLRKIFMNGLKKSWLDATGAELQPSQEEYFLNVPGSGEAFAMLAQEYPKYAEDPVQAAQFYNGLVKFGSSPTLSDAVKEFEPIIKRMGEAKYKQALVDAANKKNENQGTAQNDKVTNQENQIHDRVVRGLNTNKLLRDRLTQYQNLTNSLALIDQAESLTPQQIEEFQQSIRSNLGIKGTGGVDERSQTYFKTLGLNAANWGQFLSGDPAKLAKDSKLVNHLRDLAKVEMNNIGKQFDKSVSALSSGHKSLYEKRQDLKADLMDKIDQMKGLAGGAQVQQPLAPGQSPTPTPTPNKKSAFLIAMKDQKGSGRKYETLPKEVQVKISKEEYDAL